MAIRYPAAKARVNFGQILDQVADQGQEVIIERLGQPVVRITPYIRKSPELEEIRRRIAKYIDKNSDSAADIRKERDSH